MHTGPHVCCECEEGGTSSGCEQRRKRLRQMESSKKCSTMTVPAVESYQTAIAIVLLAQAAEYTYQYFALRFVAVTNR
jgi:hypothetical protein